MKKLLVFCLCICLLLLLCGCSAKEAIASDKQEYIVSALGFDKKYDKIQMSLEAVVVNSDDLTSEKQNKLIIGTGSTVKEAFAEINEKNTQPLMFSHCGVIAIGSDITPFQFEDIMAFCYEKDEINLSAMFISTENAENLLSCKTVSSVAMGYDIMNMVEVTSEERGIIFDNLFYEIESARNKPMKMFFMPYIEVAHKEFSLKGVNIIKNNSLLYTMNLQQTCISGFFTDNVTRGAFLIDNSEINIESSKTTYDFTFNDNFKITLNIRIKGDADREIIKKEIEKLFSISQKESRDIFGLGNIIYNQAPEIWKKIKENYDSYFKNAEIQVNING